MMKRKAVTLVALMLTGLLFLLSPLLRQQDNLSSVGLSVTRVWLCDDEPAIGRWLKKQAALYEKATGERIYLRNASKEEMEAAQAGQDQAIIPDLMIMQSLSSPLLYRGYALIVRDETANIITPAPTSALFYRPTATPGPSPTPAPEADLSAIGAILTPTFLSPSLPGCVINADPLAAFSAGKAPAALLTAGQAAQVPFGYRAYALKDGEGLLPVNAQATNEKGNDFLSFLQQKSVQQALSEYGLYSISPALRLYDESDPIRMLIEGSKK